MNNYSQLLEIHDTTYNKFKSSANPPNFVHMNLHDMKIQVAFLEEADWYGGRSVSVLSQNRKFPGKRNSLRVLLFVSTLQRDLFGRVEIQRRDPSTRAPRTRRPNSSRDPPFFVLSRLLFGMVIFYILFLCLHSQFPPVSIPFQLFNAFLVHSNSLYRTVAVFQIHANSLMFVSLLFPIARFFYYPSRAFRVFLFLYYLSLSLVRAFIPIRLVLLT